MFGLRSLACIVALALPALVSAHCVLVDLEGANGKHGVGFGATRYSVHTPHTGFYSATRILKAVRGCQQFPGCNRENGGTKMNQINWREEYAAGVKKGVPSAASDGTVTMHVLQVNTDGAGTFSCSVNTNGKGDSWKAVPVTQQVPSGPGGRNKATANQVHVLKAKVPTSTRCTGPSNSCIMSCKNVNVNAFMVSGAFQMH